MSDPVFLYQRTKGDYCLSGELDRDTVPKFWANREKWFPQDSHISLDLSSLKRIDSAGMAMLLLLQEQLKLNQQSLIFNHVPLQLKMLLELSNVEHLFIQV